MTEQAKLQAICEFVRSQGVSVRIRRVPDRRDPIPNGWYQAGRICIYTQDTVNRASETASMILHEYGHHLALCAMGPDHSEHDAWDLAALSVPRRLRPKQFGLMKKHCLQSYAALGII
jgi:hypothetical protein